MDALLSEAASPGIRDGEGAGMGLGTRTEEAGSRERLGSPPPDRMTKLRITYVGLQRTSTDLRDFTRGRRLPTKLPSGQGLHRGRCLPVRSKSWRTRRSHVAASP